MKPILTTVADFEKLKARAKVLKREFKIKHSEALEKVAVVRQPLCDCFAQ